MGAYLSSPVTNKLKSDGSDERLAYGSCAMQDMEDSHFELISFTKGANDSLFAVFDGHGGSAVARFCSDNFPSVLQQDPEFVSGRVSEGLRRTYLKLDEMLKDPEICKELKKYSKGKNSSGGDTPPANRRPVHANPALTAGCTAVVVHVQALTLTLANSGDSRAVLCRDGQAIDLTVDHKVTLESEVSRISAAGGVVLNGRVNGSLNLTRAIGDLAFKGDASLPPEGQVITANPDVFVMDVEPDMDDFIVIACDGLWEVMTSQEVIDFVSHGLRGIRGDFPSSPDSTSSAPPSSISELIGKLLDVACSDDVGKTEGLGGDNLTCIIVDLRPGKPLSNTERVSRFDDAGGEFILKPNSYKAFDFRSNSSSSSSEAFSKTDEFECRIEKLDNTCINHS